MSASASVRPEPGAPPRTSTDARLRAAFSALDDPALRVVSVDVFDTLLWRTVEEPMDAFAIIGARLQAEGLLARHITPESFFHVRARAEHRARAVLRATGGSEEVDLRQVYDQIPLHVLGAGTSIDDAVAVEVQVEKELLLPDLDVVELLLAAQEAGKRVIAVSDTYFTEAQLRALLDLPPLSPLRLDAVYASSGHGVGKGHGLFDLVLRELDVEPFELLHVGDNRVADVDTPHRLGVRTLYFERRPAQVAEVLHREHAYGYGGSGRSDAGLSALRSKIVHRTAAEAMPDELQPFWQYGAAHLGPVLTGFAEWVQHRARDVGVDTVHCLMREGAVLADLVNVAGDYVPHTGVRAEKAWLSRQLCARASLREGSAAELKTLLARRQLPTVREFCATLGVPVDDLPLFARRLDSRLDDPLLAEELVTALTSDPDRRALIAANSATLRARIVRYVQRLVPDGGRLVLVDLGWQGSIQSLLQKILRDEGVPVETLGLYLITSAGALDKVMTGVDLDGYLVVNGEPGAEAAAIMRSPELLEQVCMPDFGTQLDLTADLEPVFGPAGADAGLAQAVERDAVQKGYFAFQREWARYNTVLPDRLPALHEQAPLLRAVLTRSVVAPTQTEARLFSTWVHDENFGSEGSDLIVGGGIRRAMRHVDPAGLIALPMGELYWPFALAALTDEDLAADAEQVALGRVSPDAVSSIVEAGPFELFVDAGSGYREGGKVSLHARRNRAGLTYVATTVTGSPIRKLRLDPVNAPAVVRIDWMSFRCVTRQSPEPVEIVLDTPDSLDRLSLTRCSWLRPKLLLVDGDDPNLELDLTVLVPGDVYQVHVQCAYAVLPVSPRGPGPLVARRAAVKRRLRGPARVVRSLESRTGLPIEAALRRAYRKARAS